MNTMGVSGPDLIYAPSEYVVARSDFNGAVLARAIGFQHIYPHLIIDKLMITRYRRFLCEPLDNARNPPNEARFLSMDSLNPGSNRVPRSEYHQEINDPQHHSRGQQASFGTSTKIVPLLKNFINSSVTTKE